MNFEIVSTERFAKELKALYKKYPSIKDDLAKFKLILAANPRIGASIGSNAYKIRIGIKSKGSGKSGGGRLITYVIDKAGEIFLLSIYDKSEKKSISDKEIKQMIKELDI